jgi:aquaporin Z
MKKLLTEFVGTFVLVLAIGLSAAAGDLAPLAIGLSLMVVLYMGGHVSGAHYNPAVTLAVALRGRCSWKDAVGYWIAQIIASLVASWIVYGLIDQTFAPAPGSGVGSWTAVIAEAIWTCLLALVVLNTATAKATEGNSYFGVAIGMTVAAGAFLIGPISGGAFNPAVGIGPTVFRSLMDEGTLVHIWIYLLGPLAGGAVAAVIFKVQNPGDK